ncbi:RNA polymerase sigma factor [Paenibacillus ginsengarvi]|uniref:RNA polymerase sigma factor n=1 Tax=Paenibacillus ginsengarvi TaxID=400777 RepID=A0A3B0B2E6_9BACL|nr:RNA polymerase sigma factor [Paenibacillus ginsengarvi]RKN66134.1 RNA polymerase sigma factor [Paenibacillus ginsengarvi]
MSIEEALVAMARGDITPLRLLYDQLRSAVFSLALAILKDRQAAEDVLQETFVRVYERAASYRPGTNPKAWVVAIARNLAYDAYRHMKRAGPGEENKQVARDGHTSESAIVQRMELLDALLRLGETERQIVVMHALAGLKHREIGKELGIPAATVRWKYRQSLSRLAGMIGGDTIGRE